MNIQLPTNFLGGCIRIHQHRSPSTTMGRLYKYRTSIAAVSAPMLLQHRPYATATNTATTPSSANAMPNYHHRHNVLRLRASWGMRRRLKELWRSSLSALRVLFFTSSTNVVYTSYYPRLDTSFWEEESKREREIEEARWDLQQTYFRRHHRLLQQ